jgi:hypothetical protein
LGFRIVQRDYAGPLDLAQSKCQRLLSAAGTLMEIIDFAGGTSFGFSLMLVHMRLAIPFLILSFTSTAAAPPPESVQDLIAKLDPEQKALWDQAAKAFNSQRYADALVTYKGLLAKIPSDPILSEFASEAALNSSDNAFALAILKPLAANDPNDWQAVSLLARACAESGDTACRDSNLAHLMELHKQGVAPPNLRQFVLERVKIGDNTLVVLPSLEPIGFYKVYDLGRLMDRNGNIFMRITIESGDFDQSTFAKEHPTEAALGTRAFSLDAYRETGLNGNGQRTQTHFTYRYYVGQPTYEQVRQAFIDVANGKATPSSSRTGLIVQ